MSIDLHEERIKKAESYIAVNRDSVSTGKWRQNYHFMPEVGWMNDPNGLIYFRGKYHFFFQTNPYGSFWDTMHWGHAVSNDMLHWKYLPIALAPSEDYDNHPQGGCFSGTAIEYEGKLFLMYTSATANGDGPQQTQSIAWSEDGIHFFKYTGNPVITHPEGISGGSFRDPKIWKHDDFFYMVCGASKDGNGMALLYKSKDIFNWEYVSVLAESRGELGSMWECPDFFELNGKYVLTCSPVGSGEHTAIYMVGNFDYSTGKFDSETMNEIDWGFDFYAPQSFLAADGRRIVVAWANGWEWMKGFKNWGPTFKEGWCGYYTIPREVVLEKNNTLSFHPIEEIKAIRCNAVELGEISVGAIPYRLEAGDGISFGMKFYLDLERTEASCIELILRSGKKNRTVLSIDLVHGEIRLDRNDSDGWSHGISRSNLFLKNRKQMDIHILSDSCSLEVFACDYKYSLSNSIYADVDHNGIFMKCIGGDAIILGYESYGLSNCYEGK